MDISHHADDSSDPRVTSEYIRQIRCASGLLTLVGVVHDHPASVHRVKQVVSRSEPHTLALELPPLAIPLFEQYADSEREPPVFGGEMSAAIQAADTDVVVGIDRPTAEFFRRLICDLLRNNPSTPTIRALLSNVLAATNHAVICRVAAGIAVRTGIRLEVDTPVQHEVCLDDTPEEQARDEREHIQRSRAFMNAFRTARSANASRFVDDIRDEQMAGRLFERSEDGDLVAVVGVDHLDSIVERLETAGDATRE